MPMKEKLNIVFYTTSKPVPTVGGVERATITSAFLLQSRGHKVYSIYNSARNQINKCFEDECCLKGSDVVGQIATFLQSNKIDVVIVQTAFGMVRAFKEAAALSPCKIISVYHFEPIWDKHFVNFSRFYFGFLNNKSFKNFIRIIGYPLIKSRHLINCHVSFRQGYRLSDRIVLLTEGYTTSFLRYVGGKDNSKIVIIPNSIPSGIPDFCYRPEQKEKVILIVARLDEEVKRISLALELWKEINSIAVSQGWSLIIVGDGQAQKRYEKTIERHELNNVSLVGRQEPWDYYRRASIFLMTSRSEGWGITLLEAQKFGVVPVCYDTFAAVHDVVSNNTSAYIIPEGEKRQYKEAVLTLMNDRERREQMALAGIEHVKQFAEDVVADRWEELLFQVANEK